MMCACARVTHGARDARHHFHGRFHGLMQAGSLDITYVLDRTHKRRDYIDDFGCYAPVEQIQRKLVL